MGANLQYSREEIACDNFDRGKVQPPGLRFGLALKQLCPKRAFRAESQSPVQTMRVGN
jgi:hypothetical protein